MKEAFLIHMNEFDRFLELGLRRMLDPVTEASAPRRRNHPKGKHSPLLLVMAAPSGLTSAVVPVAEPLMGPLRQFRILR